MGKQQEQSGKKTAYLVIQGVAPSLWAARVGVRPQTAGRSADCDIQVVHDTVSRRHAEVWRQGTVLRVRDLGSRNGTFLDGVRVQDAEFEIGSTLRFGRVTLDVVPSVDDYEQSQDETEVLSRLSGEGDDRFNRLSPGQVQVVRLLLEGLPEKEVATALFLSPHTVHTHVKQIYRVLGVQSRAQFMARCLAHK